MIAHCKRLLIEWMTNHSISDSRKIKEAYSMYATCIRNTNQEGQLTIGKRYKIIQRGKLGDAIYIKCDDGRMWWMNINRFEIE